VLESLTVATTNTLGEAWDALGGAPDPYVEIRVASESAPPFISGTGSDAFEVTFTGGPTATDLRADALLTHLDFTVMDSDATSNDFMGRCVYAPLPPTTFDGTTQTLDCGFDAATMNSGFTLTWHLERF
jgi:hypothetical protein